MSEKANWFVYIEGKSWGRPVGFGAFLKNMTEEEARKEARIMFKNETSDEGVLQHTAEHILVDLADEDKELVEAEIEEVESNCFFIKIERSENLKFLPVLEEVRRETQEWEEKQKAQLKDEEQAELKRLMKKYPDIPTS